MRVGVAGLAAAVGAAAVLASASSASAATFCVHGGLPGCAGTATATLQGAIDEADQISGRDVIEIGAGTFAETGAADSDNALDIVGSGAESTILAPGDGPATVLSVQESSSTVTDLGLRIKPSGGTGLSLAGGTATRVEVAGTGPGTGFMTSGGTVREGEVALSTDQPTTGISSPVGAAPTVQTTRIEADTGIATSVIGRRLRIVAGSAGVRGDPASPVGASITLDQVTIRMVEAGVAMSAQATAFTGGFASLTARHVTAVGNGAGTGVQASASCSGAPGFGNTAAANLRNTILRGFAIDRSRTGTSCIGFDLMTPIPVEATIETAYSIFDPAKTAESGPGRFTDDGTQIPANGLGTTNLNADPLFADQPNGDFHLSPGSPAIDAADPDPPAMGELDVDVDGTSRVLDGDGDGTARRDIGAFEFVRDTTPPELTVGGAKRQKLDGAVEVEVSCEEDCTVSARGRATASGGGGGGGHGKLARKAKSRFKLRGDSESIAAGQEATLKLKLKRKARRALGAALADGGRASARISLSATDQAGNEAEATRKVKFKPPKRR